MSSSSSDNLENPPKRPATQMELDVEEFLYGKAKMIKVDETVPLYTSTTTLSKEEKLKYMQSHPLPMIDEILKYVKICKIGQGTFGEVSKSRLRTNGSGYYAVKKIILSHKSEGFPLSAIREIKLLQNIKHRNIVSLIEICRSNPIEEISYMCNFYLVFEYCNHDLSGLLYTAFNYLSYGHKKNIMKQILDGLYFLHQNQVIHRDIKPANILITKEGCIKLADFGLARILNKQKPDCINRFTNMVVSLWYRPPELFLGVRDYGAELDVWSVGCLMAELFMGTPIFETDSDKTALATILNLTGSITKENWPGIEHYPYFTKIGLPKVNEKRILREFMSKYVQEPYALDLIDKMLALYPKDRLSVDDALNHDFFFREPFPQKLQALLEKCPAMMNEQTKYEGYSNYY